MHDFIWLHLVCVHLALIFSLSLSFSLIFCCFLHQVIRFTLNALGLKITGLGIFHWFSEQITRFLRKNEQMSDLLSDSLTFGKQPERIRHGHSFLVCDLSNSLTSLIFGERPEQFAHIAH